MEFYPAILTDRKEEYTHQMTELLAVSQNIHVDFADRSLVANATLLPGDLPKVASQSATHLHAHLMVNEPIRYFASLQAHGFKTVIVHLEALGSIETAIARAREYDLAVALAINPESAVEDARIYQSQISYLQVMGVHPGFTNQDFLEVTYDRIRKARELLPGLPIAVDGGVRRHNLLALAEAGATIFVASYQGYAQNSEIAPSVREWNQLITDLL